MDSTTQLFSESPSRIVVSFLADKLSEIKEIIGDCPFQVIGKVTGEDLKISVNGAEVVSANIKELQNGWKNWLEKQLEY